MLLPTIILFSLLLQGELAQMLSRSIKSTSAKAVLDGLVQKKINKFPMLHIKYRKVFTTDFGTPILVPKTDLYGDRPITDKPLIPIPDQGLKTTKVPSQHGSNSQSKTSVDAMMYVYIGASAAGLLLVTGVVIFLVKLLHKKKSQGRVIDADSS